MLAEAGSNVPLLWDVDAPAAVAAELSPFYSAPSLDSEVVFGGDQFWRPGMRHNGAMNIGFTDGHVSASRTPLEAPGCRWDFVPGR